jgi:guanosine-3',5'-bis(diphosphate) 3'-pyrophosphohydrolase
MIRHDDLINKVSSYEPNLDPAVLGAAYTFAMSRHSAQRRASGAPYFSHPAEVAVILADLRLDVASIITALLHDTVEDGVAELHEIENQFGPIVAKLVDGVTKLGKLELGRDTTVQQAENFRKLLLAISEDIRVLLVKLADRLHNMRTLQYITNSDKRRRIARETLDIYAPLAERIGMEEMKDELEDLTFAELQPEARGSIVRRLDSLRNAGATVIPTVINELVQTLHKSGVMANIRGREKTPYSIWRKMARQEVAFEQIADVMAFRAVVPSEDDCYSALGIVNRAYHTVPGRIKDYISIPKSNGYRSLHTTVIGPGKQRIEIQIRTSDMDEVAEYGVAAHWIYKEFDNDSPPRQAGVRFRWLRELLEILENASGPEEFLEHTKLEMYRDQVFCFTPKGDLIALPDGATPVDFAYSVHSEVGDHCVGVKINGRVAPLRTQLQNGDQIEILRSSGQTPDPNWEHFVVTGKARTRVRRFVRDREANEFALLGREILRKTFSQYGENLTDEIVHPVVAQQHLREPLELFALIGRGKLDPEEVLSVVAPRAIRRRRSRRGITIPFRRNPFRAKTKDDPIAIKGLIPGMAVQLAGCCTPLPGDRIVGLITEGKGLAVHTIDCEVLESFSSTPERWLDITWDSSRSEQDTHVGRISAILNNVPGSLNALTEVIARVEGNISNLKVTNRSTDFFEFVIDVEVRSVQHLTQIIAALRADPAIFQVERVGS